MRLVRGAPGTGKTALVFREFKEALRAGVPGLRIVVPTATLVRHFQHELARDGIVFSPRSVVSLNRFLLERASVLPVADGLLRAVVRDALQRLPFPEFASVATTDGMAATIIDTIDLFENAGCTPDKLALVRRLGPHAKPFEKLWRAVGETMRRCGYCLRGDLVRAAAATQPARIWFDGFLNFTPIEFDFLRELAKGCDVTLTVADSPATEEIRRFAMRLGAADHLLPGPPRRPLTTLINARTLEREADEIARRILALHEQGVEFRRIGVALRDPSTWESLLKATFDRFGISARFYFSTALRKHPVAVFLGGLISGALGGWDFEAAIVTLRSHPRWSVRADFDRFDFAVREAMPGRGAEELLALCEPEALTRKAWLREEIAACLKPEAWKNTLQKPSEWQRRFEALATNLYRPATLETPSSHADVETARSHVAALRSWVAAIESITAFWSNPEDSILLEDFWRVASAAVDTAVLHPTDDRANVVHVMNVYEARQWDVASLFVCGMTDRDFPRRRPPNLLFPDSDIDQLRKAGIPLRKPADYEHEEQWLYDSLRTRASDSVFFSYADRDASGKSVQRSRLLLELDLQAEPAPLCRPAPRIAAPSLGTPGRVGAPALQGEMARLHQSISLTALEDLAQCRFKFFGGRTLALKGAPERPDDRLNPRVTGSILHAALESWLADKGRDFIEHFEAAFDDACRAQHLPAGYRLEVERIQFREIARRVSANDLWSPDSSEAEVALEIEFPGPIRVKCRIDRIDTFGNDCVIVDYKSSKTARVRELVESRTRLQGPLYALAVRENRHLNPVAMLYWAVRDNERYGWGRIPGADVPLLPMPENWTAAAKTRTIERLSGFLGGDVHAHPEEADKCRWCDFKAACRVETLVEIEKARGA